MCDGIKIKKLSKMQKLILKTIYEYNSQEKHRFSPITRRELSIIISNEMNGKREIRSFKEHIQNKYPGVDPHCKELKMERHWWFKEHRKWKTNKQTASFRASFSRCIKRLDDRGLIEIQDLPDLTKDKLTYLKNTIRLTNDTDESVNRF